MALFCLTTYSPYEEGILLSRIAAGDQDAFEQIYHRYAGHIYGVAYAYFKSTPHAEEIVQDVFLKLWSNRSALDAVKSPANYIFVIARNIILNQLRKNSRESGFRENLFRYFDQHSHAPDQTINYKETLGHLERAMTQLPPQQKNIYRLVYMEGLKLEEVSTKLGLSRNTVRNHLSKAVKTVRSFVRHSIENYILIAIFVRFL